MNPWFKKPLATSVLAEAPVYFVSASAAIHASAEQVWDLIKPAEKGPLLSPDVVCGFRAPNIEGRGEIQVFISVRAGVEQVSAVEVVEEIPQEMAIVRKLGEEDPAGRLQYSISVDDAGTTHLDVGQYFTLPAEESDNLARYEQHYKLGCQQYVERVRALLE